MRQNLIRELAALQERKRSLDDFELWLVSHLQQILEGDDEELRQQADKLDALLIQFGEEVVSVGELDAEIEGTLQILMTIRDTSLHEYQNVNEGTAGDQVVRLFFIDQGAVQDLRLPTFVVA